MKRKLHVRDLDVAGRRVLTRVDFNVPLDGGSVADDTRIRSALPTIRHIVEGGGSAVLMSHLGRPKGEASDALRMRPVAERLSELLEKRVFTTPDCVGEETEGIVESLDRGDVALLENLRFHNEEKKNDAAFASRLAALGDVYVNDAFGTAHRAHASTVGAAERFDLRAMGYLMETEVTNLSRVTEDPESPFLAILGGAKVSDKIGVIENLMSKVDGFLIGGGMAFTFLKARGGRIGDSLLEDDRLDVASALLARARETGKTFLLPTDVVAAESLDAGATTNLAPADDIPDGRKGLDIGPATVAAFSAEIARARTIVWNGPMGVFEDDRFAAGTEAIARAVAARTDEGATSVIGGGDSAAAVARTGLADHISHISTGGGASLEFLEGKVLPAIAVLTDAP
ncbi:MAG: phosphoglycerate kinase [Candidatus Eisenbacteria bacterium]